MATRPNKTDAPPPTVNPDDQDALDALGLDPPEYLPEEDATPAGVVKLEGLSNEDAESDVSQSIAHIRKAIMANTDELKEDASWVRVICMRMGRPGSTTASLFAVPTESGLVNIKFKPFQRSKPLHPKFVEAICDTKRRVSRKYGTAFIDYAPEPPQGDCKNNQGFRDKLTGQWVKSCTFSGCPHHPMPRGMHHSIWMAQRFIANLRSESVIRAYIRDFDHRAEVTHFANLVIDQRLKRAMEDTGLGGGGNKTLVF